MQDSHCKRLNVLIHRVKEDIWEKREDTILKCKNLLKNGLKIDDPDDIELVDIHRLPQHSLMKNGKRKTRPIVIKLVNVQDKSRIFQSAKHLRTYSEKLKKEDNKSRYVYICDHLPTKFQQQQKNLLPFYKEAKKKNQKTIWKATNGNTVCM